ncbi:hypothetical protein GF406_00895 [candidate division KSB1 bacterium]|nr:hypothetical protein [candidate division KSB1 bacterium]
MKKIKLFEWIVCSAVLMMVFVWQDKVHKTMLILFPSEYEHLKSITQAIGSFSFILGIIVFWIFSSILLHSIAILVNTNIKTDYEKLCRRIGIGFVFILIALIINRYNLDIYFQNISNFEDHALIAFTSSSCFTLCKSINYISYIFLLFWSCIILKKAYNMTYGDSLFATAITATILLGLDFVKNVFI